MSDRLRLIADRLYGGNKSGLARAIGCSHTAVNKIIAGTQEPGAWLIGKLAEVHEEINVRWLLTGKGEPFLSASETDHGAGWPLPVAGELLPGPPEENADRLKGASTFPVAGDQFRTSRYFLCVPSTMPIVKDVYLGVRAFDFLLLESNRDQIDVAKLEPARLCVIKQPWDDQLALAVVTVEDHDEGVVLTADTFDAPARKSPEARRISIIVAPGYAPEIAVQRLEPHELRRGRKPRPTPASRFTTSASINVGDIVAVAVLLVRRDPR
jgi:hypothetical protein